MLSGQLFLKKFFAKLFWKKFRLMFKEVKRSIHMCNCTVLFLKHVDRWFYILKCNESENDWFLDCLSKSFLLYVSFALDTQTGKSTFGHVTSSVHHSFLVLCSRFVLPADFAVISVLITKASVLGSFVQFSFYALALLFVLKRHNKMINILAVS